MRTISAGNAHIIRLLGKQRVKNTAYRVMRYVLRAECEDGVLLHNVATGCLALLSTEEAESLDSLPGTDAEKLTELIENRFLVPVDYDEKDLVLKTRAVLQRMLTTKGVKSYTILPTTNCNARCFYCYESDLPHVNMDEETADNLVAYMAEHKGAGTLQLHWFGGEPLVCTGRIDQICEALNARGIKFVSSMTSNGYLFSESLVEKAKALWKLNSVQITLDGTEEVYNRTKSYAGVTGSPYQRVLNNIQLLADHRIRVVIRLNLDKHNMSDLQTLIGELDRRIQHREMLDVYSHVLFENAGFAPIERDEADRAELYTRQTEINTELEKLKLRKSHQALPFLKTHNCMADADNAVVVYPDGSLYKCEHIALEDRIGRLGESDIQEEGIAKFRITAETEACGDCPLYPSCILLKNCQGLPDKNPYTCCYDIQRAERSLNAYYHQWKSAEGQASDR